MTSPLAPATKPLVPSRAERDKRARTVRESTHVPGWREMADRINSGQGPGNSAYTRYVNENHGTVIAVPVDVPTDGSRSLTPAQIEAAKTTGPQLGAHLYEAVAMDLGLDDNRAGREQWRIAADWQARTRCAPVTGVLDGATFFSLLAELFRLGRVGDATYLVTAYFDQPAVNTYRLVDALRQHPATPDAAPDAERGPATAPEHWPGVAAGEQGVDLTPRQLQSFVADVGRVLHTGAAVPGAAHGPLDTVHDFVELYDMVLPPDGAPLPAARGLDDGAVAWLTGLIDVALAKLDGLLPRKERPHQGGLMILGGPPPEVDERAPRLAPDRMTAMAGQLRVYRAYLAVCGQRGLLGAVVEVLAGPTDAEQAVVSDGLAAYERLPPAFRTGHVATMHTALAEIRRTDSCPPDRPAPTPVTGTRHTDLGIPGSAPRAVGDLPDPAPGRPASLAEFLARGNYAVADFQSATGLGAFDLEYEPATGTAVVTLRVLVNVRVPGVDRVAWTRRYLTETAAAWNRSAPAFRCLEPGFGSLPARPVVRLVEDPKEPHFVVNVEGDLERNATAAPRRYRPDRATLSPGTVELRPGALDAREKPYGGSQTAAVHESVHMLGLGDAYDSNAAHGVPWPGATPRHDALVREDFGHGVPAANDDRVDSNGDRFAPEHYVTIREALEYATRLDWTISSSPS